MTRCQSPLGHQIGKSIATMKSVHRRSDSTPRTSGARDDHGHLDARSAVRLAGRGIGRLQHGKIVGACAGCGRAVRADDCVRTTGGPAHRGCAIYEPRGRRRQRAA